MNDKRVAHGITFDRDRFFRTSTTKGSKQLHNNVACHRDTRGLAYRCSSLWLTLISIKGIAIGASVDCDRLSLIGEAQRPRIQEGARNIAQCGESADFRASRVLCRLPRVGVFQIRRRPISPCLERSISLGDQANHRSTDRPIGQS